MKHRGDMSERELAAKISAAYAWHRALGNSVVRSELATFVFNGAHPRIWSANHASGVRASARHEIAAVFDEAERRFSHCPQRVFTTDAFTPPAFVARLACDDYLEQTLVIQMVLLGELKAAPKSGPVIRPVVSPADWQELAQLVETDFREGQRSGGPLDADLVSGLIDGYQKKAGAAQFFLAEAGSEPCAYGSAVECPDRVGILEDFFTLPAYRGRGIATAIIACCVERLRRNGAEVIFIGAHATGAAKRLYARMGFAPLLVSREWVKGALD